MLPFDCQMEPPLRRRNGNPPEIRASPLTGAPPRGARRPRSAAPSAVPTPEEETLLVSACLAGDRVAWRRLIERYEGVIFAIPRRYGLTEEDAAEVFQTVCLAIFRGLPRLRLAAGLTRWVLVTTQRTARDLAVRRRREVPDVDGALSAARRDEAPLPDELLAEMERRVAVRAALRELSGRCRELLQWLYLDPDTPSYREIARRLEIPEGTVGPTRARCLERLKLIVEKVRQKGTK